MSFPPIYQIDLLAADFDLENGENGKVPAS
jgi:hypothetical protein